MSHLFLPLHSLIFLFPSLEPFHNFTFFTQPNHQSTFAFYPSQIRICFCNIQRKLKHGLPNPGIRQNPLNKFLLSRKDSCPVTPSGTAFNVVWETLFPAFGVANQYLSILHLLVSATRIYSPPCLPRATPFANDTFLRTTLTCLVFWVIFQHRPCFVSAKHQRNVIPAFFKCNIFVR